MTNRTDNTKELSFQTLLLKTLFRWRLILIAAILGAALGCLVQAVRSGENGNSYADSDTEYSKAMKQYEEESSYYKDQEENLEQQIEDKQKYLRDSLKSHIDPKNEGYASVNLIINSEDTENKEIATAQICEAYASYFKNSVDWDTLAEQMETEPEYLQELVTVAPDPESRQTISFVNVYLKAIAKTEEEAQNILDYMLKQLPEAEETISASNPHTITEAYQSSGYRVDNELNASLHADLDLIQNLKDDLKTLQSDGAAVTQPRQSVSVSRSEFLKRTGKYAAAGLIGGAVLMYILIAVYLVFHHRVLSAEEMNGTYGLVNLVTYPSEQKKGLDRWLRKGIPADAHSEDDAYRIAALNLAASLNHAGSVKRMILCGHLPEQILRHIAQRLERALQKENLLTGMEIVPVAQIAGSPDALEQLRKSDGVILAEKTEYSDYHRISRDVAAIDGSGKCIFGSIILEN